MSAHALKLDPSELPLAPDADPTLRLYAIIRGDLRMTPGKLAVQAGHAYLDAFLQAQQRTPDIATEYLGDSHGTKVCLVARSLDALLRAQAEAECAGIPCALITDSGHAIPGTPFTGEPLITALGIGPAWRAEVRHLTKRFALVP